MEYWSDFHCSPLDDQSFYNLLSSPAAGPENDKKEWTFEENKLFENATADMEPGTQAFFENVASMVPWKSIEEIKGHYQALVEDLEMIENGLIPVPDYNQTTHVVVDDHQEKKDQQVASMEIKKDKKGSPSNVEAKTKNGGQQRKRGVPWTDEEHQLFLMGLHKYGKGDWRSISRYYVITKTPTQVASHAQKYFRRQTSTTPPDRRRPSIHDIQTVNPINFTSMMAPQMHANSQQIMSTHQEPSAFASFPSSPGLLAMLNCNWNINGFSPMNSTAADPMYNQGPGAYPSQYLFSSPGN